MSNKKEKDRLRRQSIKQNSLLARCLVYDQKLKTIEYDFLFNNLEDKKIIQRVIDSQNKQNHKSASIYTHIKCKKTRDRTRQQRLRKENLVAQALIFKEELDTHQQNYIVDNEDNTFILQQVKEHFNIVEPLCPLAQKAREMWKAFNKKYEC